MKSTLFSLLTAFQCLTLIHGPPHVRAEHHTLPPLTQRELTTYQTEYYKFTNCDIPANEAIEDPDFEPGDQVWLITHWGDWWPCHLITACVASSKVWGYGVRCLKPHDNEWYKRMGVSGDVLRPIYAQTPAPTPAKRNFKIDERIWGLWMDSIWYPGRVYSLHKGGAYDVVYDDGMLEEKVSYTNLRYPIPGKANTREIFSLKERVKAVDLAGKYQLGVVRVRQWTGSEYEYTVEFDDESIRKDIPLDEIHTYVVYLRKQNVQARICKWEKATIMEVIPDGRYNIRWGEGTALQNVDYESIRKVYTRFESTDQVMVYVCHNGDYKHEPVLEGHEQKCHWYKGWVVAIQDDDTYLIQFSHDGVWHLDFNTEFERLVDQKDFNPDSHQHAG